MPGKRGGDLKNMLTAIALASRHRDLQIDGVKTDRQSLHTTDPFALTNYVPAPALRAEVEFVQRLDRHEHSTLSDLRAGGTVALTNTKHLVQQCIVH